MRLDVTGKKYGRLTALRFHHASGKHSYWLWRCDCGTEKIARLDCVKVGMVSSCGCANKDSHPPKHGYSRTKLYHVFYSMKQRCYNPKCTVYQYYGGRGISIDPAWMSDNKAFCDWAMNNGYREGLTIDRIDVNGDYTPENCRWITQREQVRNTRRNTHITFNGKTQLLKDWCEELGVNIATACYRIRAGKPLEEVFKPTSKV